MPARTQRLMIKDAVEEAAIVVEWNWMTPGYVLKIEIEVGMELRSRAVEEAHLGGRVCAHRPFEVARHGRAHRQSCFRQSRGESMAE